MNKHKSRVSQRVKRLRIERAWSQEQLAQISGVNVRTIQRLENGAKVSMETLKAIAAGFGIDVRELTEEQTSSPKGKGPKVLFVPKMTSGNDLCSVIQDTDGHQFQNDELETNEEVALVGNFLQDASDSGSIWSNMEPLARVEAGYRFTNMIKELEKYGLWVFASKKKTYLHMSIGPALPFTALVILILRNTNPKIVKTLPSLEFVPVLVESEPPDNVNETSDPDDIPF
jgi:transcriptional regulator with XRE-family HTH domain